MIKKNWLTVFGILLFICAIGYSYAATQYRIAGTDYYVTGKPTDLNKTANAKLITPTIAEVDAAVAAKKFTQLTTKQAKEFLSPVVQPPVEIPTTPPISAGWLKCADEWKTCQFQKETKLVRLTNGKEVSKEKSFVNYAGCSRSNFENSPSGQVWCEFTTGTTTVPPVTKTCPDGTANDYPKCTPIVVTPTDPLPVDNPMPPTGSFMPLVDTSKNMASAIGLNKLIVRQTSEQPTKNEFANSGAVRVDCKTASMSNNDPIVYPGQKDAAHHHTFFGATNVNENTTHSSLLTGNSTCSGGIMNRSAYWVPSMINTKTNTPIEPVSNTAYYKTGDSMNVTAPPEGLRMIAGNSKANSPFSGNQANWRFTCNEDYSTHADHIPDCPYGVKKTNTNNGANTMEYLLIFPECWDGKNLDSPNHQDHMAYPGSGGCPSTHPVRIPQIAFNIHYKFGSEGTKAWRLSSDNYPMDKPGGYSAHGDWMEGWDRTMLKVIVENCLRAGKDCHAHLTGDGREFGDGTYWSVQ